MEGGLRTENIVFQGSVIALDDSEVLAREEPEVALPRADAAVAFAGRLDLRDVDLVDERTAMAIAAVSLERLLTVGHGKLSSGSRAV